MTRIATSAALSLLILAAGGCSGDPAAVSGESEASAHATHLANQPEGSLLAEVRRATARYHDIDAALADGYGQGSPCEVRAEGGMGYHYRKLSLIDGTIDPTQPEILMYEPQANGKLRLVGVEFLIPAAAWDPFHNSAPVFGDAVFEDRRAPGSGGPPFPNYGLHMWLWENNPAGIYEPWNPNINCDFAP